MALAPKGTDIFTAVKVTGDYFLEEAAEDSVASLKAEILAAIMVEVHSAVGPAKREVLMMIVEEFLRDILMEGYEAAKAGVRDLPYQYT